MPAVETLRRVWLQTYTLSDADGVRWRQDDNIPPAAVFISSPYDTEAHYATKRSASWVGYAEGGCILQKRAMMMHRWQARHTIAVRPEAQYKALQAAREREQTEEYTKQYARLAGIEGTVSQGVRISGLRRSRYRSLIKTHLQHILTACALNIIRIMRWLVGEPSAQTR